MIITVCCSRCQNGYELSLASLSTMEREIFAVLAEKPSYMPRSRLADIIYADREDGGPLNAGNVISQRIFHINRKFGFRVIEHSYGHGYRISVDNPVNNVMTAEETTESDDYA